MKREELLKSKEYWTGEIQLDLFELIDNYLKENNISRVDLAKKLGVSKGYISQIMNGDFDHRISKLVELAMAVGKIPRIEYYDLSEILYLDSNDKLHEEGRYKIKIELNLRTDSGISISTNTNAATIEEKASDYKGRKELENEQRILIA